MNNKLQIKILKIFVDSDSPSVAIDYVMQKLAEEKVSRNDVKKNISFLLDDGALMIDCQVNNKELNCYRVTKWGYKKSGNRLLKLIYWLIYRNHNLFSIIALLISLIALFFSIWFELKKITGI